MNRVAVKPELLRWAISRSGRPDDDIIHRFPKYPEWEDGSHSPTLKQIEKFSKVTRTPIGFLFLPTPPVDRVPIPDRARDSDHDELTATAPRRSGRGRQA